MIVARGRVHAECGRGPGLSLGHGESIQTVLITPPHPFLENGRVNVTCETYRVDGKVL